MFNIFKKSTELANSVYNDTDVSFVAIGKKGNDFLQKSYNVESNHIDIFDNLNMESVSLIAESLMQMFVNEDFDKIVAHSIEVDWELKDFHDLLEEMDLEDIAKGLKFGSEEDMFAAVGAGDLRISQVINAAQMREEKAERDSQLDLDIPTSKPRKAKSTSSGVNILGIGNLMTQFASCCKPVPGDAIAGFITQGRGVSIHRADCVELERLREREANRILDVDWDDGAEIAYPVDVVIEAFDRSGLLRDVMVILANEKVNVLGANTHTDRQSNQAHLEITLEIGRLDKLGKVMDKINQIPNVNDVHRKRTGVH